MKSKFLNFVSMRSRIAIYNILHCLSTTNTTNYASCLFPCNNSPKKIGLWLFLDFENQFRLMKESHGQHLGIAEAGGGGGGCC